MEPLSAGDIVFRLIIILFIIALNGFFSATEFALVSVRRTRIEQLAAEGDRAAKLVHQFLDRPERFIAAVQLGVSMASLALGWVGESTMAAIIEPPLRALFGGSSSLVANTIGTVFTFALVTYLQIVLGEQVPKGVALRFSEEIALNSVGIMDAFYRIFRPFISVLDRSAQAVLKAVGAGTPTAHRSALSVQELQLLLEESQREGVLEEEIEDMVQRVLRFGERLVREVMIPRNEVLGVGKTATVDEVLRLFVDSRHARFPVYEGDLDNIIGIITMIDILAALAQNSLSRNDNIAPLIRPAFCVPETRKVGTLFSEMRERHIQMAVVLDEYGGTAGIVTLEMLTEEVVGEIGEEWAPAEPILEHLGTHTFRINAQLRIDEVNEELGLNLPESEDYETLAGFILYQMQKMPEEGEVFHHQGLEFKIAEMQGPRIVAVDITTKGASRAGGHNETPLGMNPSA